jgi:hypothetical protein
MTRDLILACPSWTGTWHRIRVIDHARTFVRSAGCQFHFLWAVSSGVSYCRFEELLAPIPGVRIFNLSETEMNDLEQKASKFTTLVFSGEKFDVYRAGGRTSGRMFTFDFAGARALEAAVANSPAKRVRPVQAIPAAELSAKATRYIRDFQISRRVGIRVRVTECPIDGRKPRRVQGELDDAIKSIIRAPWHIPVFLVTDSEYVQQMLASHFHDNRFLPKKFTEKCGGYRYVSRHDREGMRTFMTEVMCLTACRKIVNIGGFLNQDLVADKIVGPPWESKLLSYRRVG